MTTQLFECGLAALTYRGEKESGDRHLVSAFDTGALVAVIDALGHGHDASQAADLATRVLAQHAHEMPISLVQRCHAEMRDSRGAAYQPGVLRLAAGGHDLARRGQRHGRAGVCG
jgi:hypothetical protein